MYVFMDVFGALVGEYYFCINIKILKYIKYIPLYCTSPWGWNLGVEACRGFL
jgi:hypothetical protein